MREIKFRIRYIDELLSSEIKTIIVTFEQLMNMDFIRNGVITRDLYTGLKDKNGVEIFEGDIIEITHQSKHKSIHIVEDLVYTHEFCYVNSIDFHLMGIVIGNIYENPEMLK